MTNTIGELLYQGQKPLLKMWSTYVNLKERPFVKHSHTRFEITLVNNGSGEYTTESAVYPMLPGDVFVFSSNEPHCITKTGENGLDITNLHFEPRYLNEEFSDSYIDLCFFHSDSFCNRISADKADKIRSHYTTIKEELSTLRPLSPVSIKSHLVLLLIDLLRNHNYRSNIVESKSTLFNILSVYDYIDKNLDKPLTLKELSLIANLSPNYFCSVFKQLNGISLWEYITAKRIEKAVALIRSGDKSLTVLDIALMCGFNNTVNFNKAFKKQKGITPSQLRKDTHILPH